KPSPVRESLVLHVEKLSRNVNEGHLKEIFSNFGEVVSVELAMDRTVNLPKGYGYVQFKTRGDAEKALLYMDGAQIDGNVIKARFTLPPRQKVSPPPKASAVAPKRDTPRTDNPSADVDKDGPKPSPRRKPPPSPRRRSPVPRRAGSPRRPDSPRRRADSPIRRRLDSPYRRGGDTPPRRRPVSPGRGRSPSPPRRLRSPPRVSPRRLRGSPGRRRSPPPPPRRRSPPRRARSPPRRSPIGRRRTRSPIRRSARSRSRSFSPRRRKRDFRVTILLIRKNPRNVYLFHRILSVGRPPVRRGRSSSYSDSPSPR
ncbi:Serine/arginine-rich splicing factor SR45, partial [Mucuna pruriens]